MGKRHAVNAPDPAGQMTLIGKARACCNLREAGSPVTYQFCCALQSKMHDVTMRRYAHRSSEHASKVKWTAPCYARKISNFDRFIQMSNDVVPDPSEHLFSQAASRTWRWTRLGGSRAV